MGISWDQPASEPTTCYALALKILAVGLKCIEEEFRHKNISLSQATDKALKTKKRFLRNATVTLVLERELSITKKVLGMTKIVRDFYRKTISKNVPKQDRFARRCRKKNCGRFAFSNDSNVEYENSYGILYLLSGK